MSNLFSKELLIVLDRIFSNDKQRILTWLQSEPDALNGKSPMDVIRRDGPEKMVERLLSFERLLFDPKITDRTKRQAGVWIGVIDV